MGPAEREGRIRAATTRRCLESLRWAEEGAAFSLMRGSVEEVAVAVVRGEPRETAPAAQEPLGKVSAEVLAREPGVPREEGEEAALDKPEGMLSREGLPGTAAMA